MKSFRSVAIAALLLLYGASVHAEDWPTHRGKGRDGIWTETGILEKFPEGGLKVRWRTPVKRGYSGPVVANGRVFVTDFVADQEGGTTGIERALALDEATGKILWTKEWGPVSLTVSWPNGPGATPVVDGDVVYTLGRRGHFNAFNVKSGETLWNKDFEKDYKADRGSYGFVSSPLVDGNRLICIVGAEPNGKVVAFDKLTGKEIWRALPNTEDIGVSSPKIIEYGGARQLIIYHPEGVASLNPVTGAVYWTLPFHSEAAMMPMTPEFNNGYLLVSTFYNGSMLAKLDPRKRAATMLWKGKSKSEVDTDGLHSVMGTPFIKGDYIYGTCSYGQLRCLRLSTGERVWETQDLTQEFVRWSTALMVRNGDRFFASTDRGDLVIGRVSEKGYEEIDRTFLIKPTTLPGNRRKLTYVVWTHPAYANKHIYVRNDEEIISASLAAEPASAPVRRPPPADSSRAAPAGRGPVAAAPVLPVPPSQNLTITFVRGLRRGDADALRSNYMLSNMYLTNGNSGLNTLQLEVDDGLLLVDTQSKGWENAHLNVLRRGSRAPITRIINTSPRGAATNTNFPEAKEIFAHENTRARLAKMADYAGANARFLPNRTFKDKLTVPLPTVGGHSGENRVDLYYFGPAHSDGDIVAVFPAFGTAYIGELFPDRALPAIDTANGGSMLAYPDTLAKFAAGFKNEVIENILPAHGTIPATQRVGQSTVIGTWFTKQDLDDYVEFNRAFVEAIRSSFKAGRSVDEAVAELRMPEKFRSYGMQNARINAEILYRELGR